MPGQENGGVKQMKLRIPMELFQQLVKDAKIHKQPPSTRARHILVDALMDVPLTEQDFQKIEKMKEENWAKLKGDKNV